MHFSIRFSIIAIFTIVVTTVLINATIDTSYFHGLATDRINKKIDEVIPGSKLSFDTINLQFFPPTINLYGFKITDRNAEELAAIAHVEARVSLLSLFLFKPKLARLEVTSVAVNLPFPSADTAAIDPKTTSQGLLWPPDFEIPIENLIIRDGRVNWLFNADVPTTQSSFLNVEGINLALNHRSWTSWLAKVSVSSVNLFIDGAQLLKNTQVGFTAQGGSKATTISELQVLSRQLSVGGGANINYETRRAPIGIQNKRIFTDFIEALHITSQLKVKQADMAILGEFLGASDSDGLVDGEVQVQATLPLAGQTVAEPWLVTGRARSFSARLAGFRFLQSNINFSVKNDSFIFDHIEIRKDRQVAESLATGQGLIGFDSKVPLRFLIEPKNILLEDLLYILKVDDADFLTTELQSEKLLLEGQGSPLDLSLRGLAKLTELSIPQVRDLDSFPERPSCLFDLNLQITMQQVTIPATQGRCFAPSRPDITSPVLLEAAISYDTATGMNLRLASDEFTLELAQHFAKVSMTGLAKIESIIKGPYDNLVVDNKLTAKTFSIAEIPGKNLSATAIVDIASRTVLLPQVSFQFASRGSVTLQSGRLTIDGLVLSGDVDLNGISSESVERILRNTLEVADLEFAIDRLKGSIAVPLLEPLASRGRLKIEASSLEFQQKLLLEQISGLLVADTDSVSAQNLTLRHKGLLYALNYQQERTPRRRDTGRQSTLAELGLNPQDTFKLTLAVRRNPEFSPKDDQPLQARSSSYLPFAGPVLATSNIGFDLELDATIEGSFASYKGGFGARLDNFLIFHSEMAPIQLTGFIEDGQISIPLIRQSGNSFVARFNLDLTKAALPYSLVAYFDQFDLRALLSPFFAEDPRNYAYLSAEADLSGNLTEIFDSRGYLSFKKFRGQFFQGSGSKQDKISLASDDPIRLELQPGSWNFQSGKALRLYSEKLGISISMNQNNPPNNLNIVGDGTVNLALLKDLVPSVETAQGQLDFTFSLLGSIRQPKLNLTLEDRKLDPFDRKRWEPLAIGFVDMNPAITNIESQIKLKDNVLYIEKLRGNKGRNGRIAVSGKVDFTSNNPIDSQLQINLDGVQMDRLAIPVFKSANATLSGDLSLIGRQLPLQLSGNINIDEAASVTDFDLRKQIISNIRKSQAAPPLLQSNPMLNLDIAISSGDDIYIKNKNMDVTLQANLALKGSEQEPIILGQIETVKGTFTYRRDFDIQRSFVSFEEAIYPPDPRLDIVGKAEVKTEGISYLVTIIISGKASDPKVALSIDPPTKPDGTAATKLDVLVLLTTGRMRSLGSPTGDTLQNEALLLLAGYAETPLEKIFDLTGQQYIRQIYFDSYLPPATDDKDAIPIARANLPITITDDLNIILQYDRNENIKGLFQYSLNEKITVSGSVDPQAQDANENDDQNLPADTGVDLKFKFSFE